jgi:hypothetical protein
MKTTIPYFTSDILVVVLLTFSPGCKKAGGDDNSSKSAVCKAGR